MNNDFRMKASSKKSSASKFWIYPNGTVKAIYSDSIDLSFLGEIKISRASHVEPGLDNNWYADMLLVGGPTLGPFPKRQQALGAEIKWLENFMRQVERDRISGHLG